MSVSLNPQDPRNIGSQLLCRIEELIDMTTERFRDLSTESFMRRIHDQECVLWTLYDEQGELHGVMVTCIMTTETDYMPLVVEVMSWDGPPLSKEAFEKLTDEMLEVARHLGCHALRICGRKGWAKVLTGFKEVARIWDRPLEG